MIIKHFEEKDTAIHNLDPRSKMVWLLGLSIMAMWTMNPIIILFCLFWAFLMNFLAKVPFIEVLKYIWFLAIPLWIGGIIACLIIGETLLGAATHGTIFAAKSSVLLVAVVAFYSSTSQKDIMAGLISLKFPYTFAFLVTLAISLIPQFEKEITLILTAQKARGHEVLLSFRRPIQSLKSFMPIIIPLLNVVLIQRSVQMGMALDSRGFGSEKKSLYKKIKIKGSDLVLLLLSVLTMYYVLVTYRFLAF